MKSLKTLFFLLIGGIATILYLAVLLIIGFCDAEAADALAKVMFEKDRGRR